MTAALVGVLICLPFGSSATKYSVEAPAGSTVAIRLGKYENPLVRSYGGDYDAATDTAVWYNLPKDRALGVAVDGPGGIDAEARVYLKDGSVVASRCSGVL